MNYTAEELARVIDSHGKWLRGESDGTRADLSDADLSRAIIRFGANLFDADLTDAIMGRFESQPVAVKVELPFGHCNACGMPHKCDTALTEPTA